MNAQLFCVVAHPRCHHSAARGRFNGDCASTAAASSALQKLLLVRFAVRS
jgi:hypothetical protein